MQTETVHRVSFVVLSHNSARTLEACVRSLAAQAAGTDRDEVWIVENGSIDGSRALVRQLAGEMPDVVRPIFLNRNGGTTGPRNLALERAKGRFVAIVDSDVEVPPGAVDTLIARLEATPRCGLIAPRLVFPDGRRQLSTDVFPTLWRKVMRLVGLRRMERRLTEDPATGPTEVDYAISAFWLMRRTLLERTGLLDRRIFYSPEDVDFCLRVWRAGYSVVYEPAAYAVHHAQEMSRKSLLHWATWSHLAGLVYLFRKHRYVFGRGALYRRIGRYGY